MTSDDRFALEIAADFLVDHLEGVDVAIDKLRELARADVPKVELEAGEYVDIVLPDRSTRSSIRGRALVRDLDTTTSVGSIESTTVEGFSMMHPTSVSTRLTVEFKFISPGPMIVVDEVDPIEARNLERVNR